MNTYFPQSDKKYIQTNRSNVLGNLWSTTGLDFQENLGVMRVSTRLQVLTKTGDANATNLGRAVGFKGFDSAYWTVAGSRVFCNKGAGGLANSVFAEDTVASASTDYSSDYSDIAVFNSKLWVTAPSQLRSTDAFGGAWTDRQTFIATTVPHQLCPFVKLNRLYFVFNGNTIGNIDDSNNSSVSGDYTLIIDTKYGITSIKATSDYIYISVVDSRNPTGLGAVIQWDGKSAQATEIYDLKARGGECLVILNNEAYVMDSKGILSKYQGNNFLEVGRLPGNNKRKGIAASTNIKFIHPNGMVVTKNDTILAFINNVNEDTGATIDENFPSGIWEWSKDIGFTHKRALTYNSYGTTTITDYGQNRVSDVGGIALCEDTADAGIQTLMIGATYYTNASSTTNGIFIENTDDTIQKKGYFVTSWVESEQIAEGWTRLWSSFRRFLDSGDKIIFKYRDYEVSPIEATITWVDTLNFTTTTNITAYGPTATGFNGTVGGEVEITQGTGGASCVHITNIVNNAGTYTVTIDETVTGVTTGTAKARFQKWIKLNPSTPLDQIKAWAQFGIDTESTPRFELKGCFTYTGTGEFYRAITVSNSDIKITL